MIKIEEDRIFLHDQRTELKMVMGVEDKALSKKEQAARKRTTRLLERLAQENEIDAAIYSHADYSLPSSSDDSEKEDNNQFVPVPGKLRASLPKRQRSKSFDIVSPLVAALDRTGTSNRQAV